MGRAPRLGAAGARHTGRWLLLAHVRAGYGRRTLLALALEGRATTVTLSPRTALSEVRDAIRGGAADEVPLPQGIADITTEWLVLLNWVPRSHGDLLDEVAAAARRARPELRIAVTATEVAPAWFRLLRLEGRLVHIDQTDLALDHDEAHRLLTLLAPDASAPDHVLDLCDGWAAALVAAAEWHRTRPANDLGVWLRTHGAEMLVGGWFESRSPAVRTALLDTAVLEKLTPELVDAVTGTASGAALPELARPHGMIRVSLHQPDPDVVWFERHPLLTALLQYQALARSQEQERYRRAAGWFRARGDLTSELKYLLAAGDAAAASARFHEQENDLLLTGRAETAVRWYSGLPRGRAAGELFLREAWASALSGRLLEATTALGRLRTGLTTSTAQDGEHHEPLEDVAAEADVLDAWLCETLGDVRRMNAAAISARAQFGDVWSTNAHQLAALLHARSWLLLGDEAAAEEVLGSVRDNPYASAALGEGRRTETEAAVAWARGNVHQARSWAARYDRWLRSRDSETPKRYTESITGKLCLAEAGEPQAAAGGLHRILDELSRPPVNLTDRVEALLALSQVHAMAGQLGPALEAVQTARRAVVETSPAGGLLAHTTAQLIRVRLAGGDRVRAARLLRELPPGITSQLLHARLAAARGTPNALRFAREIEPRCPRQEVERGVLVAWALMGTSRQRAERSLLDAADLAGQNGIASALCGAPDPLLALARGTATHHVHDHLAVLVSTASQGREMDVRAASGAHQAEVARMGLTRGDLQMLAILPTSAPKAKIAAEFGVSVNTVKTRIQRLYTKLGVHDRDAAVEAAIRLGLVGDRQRAAPPVQGDS